MGDMGYTAEILNEYLESTEPENPFGNHEPVLERDQIRYADDLEEVVELYQENGEEFDDLDDLWTQLTEDWYWENREYGLEQGDELPSDTVKLRYREDGQEKEKNLHIHGINHGGTGIMELNPRVKQYIADSLDELTDEERPLLAEENLKDVVLDYTADKEHIEEINDHKVLGEEVDLLKLKSIFETEDESYTNSESDTEESKLGKFLDSPVYRALEDLQKFQTRKLIREDELDPKNELGLGLDRESERDNLDTLIATLDDKTGIKDLQNAAHAKETPYHLKEDYREQRLLEARKDSKKAKQRLKEDLASLNFNIKEMAANGFEAFVPPAVTETKNQVGAAIGKHRSQYLADRSLEKLSEDVEEVHTLVGAAHQPQMLQHIDEMNDSELSELIGVEPEDIVEVELEY